MLGRKKKPIERLPWYRARNYRGDLTENEKRQLDSFRMRREHPAASYDTLPGEVKVYMGELTLEIYDTKQERLRVACSVVSGASVFPRPLRFWLCGGVVVRVLFVSWNAYIPLDLLPHKMEEKCRRIFTPG